MDLIVSIKDLLCDVLLACRTVNFIIIQLFCVLSIKVVFKLIKPNLLNLFTIKNKLFINNKSNPF